MCIYLSFYIPLFSIVFFLLFFFHLNSFFFFQHALDRVSVFYLYL